MTTRDEAREKLAAAIGPVVSASIRKWQDGKLSSREAYRLARHVTLDVSGLLSPDAGPDQPRPSVSEDICDAPSLRESADLDAAMSLLSEGLDLCVRAKKLDEAIERAVAVGRSEDGGTQCLTPALWVQGAYDRDLGIWELRAKGLLTRLAPIGMWLGNRKDGSSPKTTDKGGE